MPGGVLFLNYWRRRKDFPEQVQLLMKRHWLEEVEYLKTYIKQDMHVIKSDGSA